MESFGLSVTMISHPKEGIRDADTIAVSCELLEKKWWKLRRRIDRIRVAFGSFLCSSALPRFL
jgi:hypothetical protein